MTTAPRPLAAAPAPAAHVRRTAPPLAARRWLARGVVHTLLLLVALVSITPFAWAALNALKLPRDANARTPVFPFTPTGVNYERLWLNRPSDDVGAVLLGVVVLLAVTFVAATNARRLRVPRLVAVLGAVAVLVGVLAYVPRLLPVAPFYSYFLNSLIVTVGTVLISITIGCLAGYALARYRGGLGVAILFTALAFRALPRLAFVLPYYYLGQITGLYDTRLLLIIVLVAVNQPFTIWMLRSFFMDVPHEIEEAAMMDGCSRLRAFVQVIVPIMWPGIITTALFTVLLAYNEFLIPRIITQSNWTLPVGIAQYTGGEDARYLTLAAAGAVSITLPIVVVILFFQRYLIAGLSFGAVKG